MRKLFIFTVIIVAALFLGILIGWFIRNAHYSSSLGQNTSNISVRVNLPQYSLIAPPLYSQTTKSSDPAFNALAATLGTYVASTTASGAASSVSIYFRDLNTGQWTGVNENDMYRPSSMLKVIAMLAALKLAEQNPAILQEKLPYRVSTSTDLQYYKPDDTMVDGDYEVEDLVGVMIRYSDNDALTSLLSDSQINNEFSQIYSLFRLPPVSATTTMDFMSPKSYSGLFISLYNSTFFQWDLSEQVLNLLANTTFTQGLVAGVPSGTIVAHKFGENTDVSLPSGGVVDRELHDCGIVYAPGKPYLLCVMTRGSSTNTFPNLAGVISGVSKLVYTQVEATSTGL